MNLCEHLFVWINVVVIHLVSAMMPLLCGYIIIGLHYVIIMLIHITLTRVMYSCCNYYILQCPDGFITACHLD